MKKYFVITKFDGEIEMSVKTEKELAEAWEQDDICGIGMDFTAYEYVDGGLKEVNVYELATAYLHDRDEMQREYEEYTEYVNEYGHEPCQDDLEMGFNPYMGTYDYDC